MKRTTKTKVAPTPADIAKALAAVGHKISRQQVAKDAANGADLSSADAYLAWKQASEQRSPRKLAGNPVLARLREEKITEEIALLRIRKALEENRLAEEEGRLVSRAKVRADMDWAATRAVAVLRQKFETELPPKQDGMPADKIGEMNRAALDEVSLILSQPKAYARDAAP